MEKEPITFHSVDVDGVPGLAKRLNIAAMPTFHIYKGTELVSEVVGADYPKIVALVEGAVKA